MNAARALLAAGLAALVVALVWLDGRRLLRARGGPLLAERWTAYRTRASVAVVALAGVVPFVVPGIATWLALPLVVALAMAAHHPVRCAVLGETWGRSRYMVTMVRRSLAFAGFWAIVALAPVAIRHVPEPRWLTAALLLLALMAAVRYGDAIFVRLIEATVLRESPPGFDGVLARASLNEPVTVYRAGAPGGRWLNAFAAPASRGGIVVFGDTLFDILDADARTAIFAHEVAHLERALRRRVLRSTAAMTVLALAATAGGLALARLDASIASTLAILWALTVPGVAIIWLLAHRAHEADADLRALALCGDAEALVRGLVALHRAGESPRRWSPAAEGSGTHPSLARRIQAIRRGAGGSPRSLGDPVVLGRPPGPVVILDEEKVEWVDGVAGDVPRDAEAVRRAARSSRALGYEELTELRLVAGIRGDVQLRARERSGRRWHTTLSPDDVAQAQAALDVVDLRLSTEPAVSRVRDALLVLLALAAGAAAWARTGVSPVIVLAAIVLVRPRQAPPWLVGVLVATWLAQEGLGPHGRQSYDVTILLATVMAAALTYFVILPAASGRGAARATSREATLVAGALALFAVVVGSAVLWMARTAGASIPSGRIHAIALALLGAGAVMALARSVPHRLAAAVVLALGVATFWRGAEVVAAWVPLGTGSLAVSEASTATTYRGSLDRTARRLMLSPSGTRFAVRVGTSQRDEADDVLVGHVGGAPRQVVVHDFSFLDDERAIAVVPSATGLEMRALAVDRPDDGGWSVSIPPLRVPRVSGDGGTGIWGVAGWDPAGPGAVTASGRMPGAAVDVRRWRVPDDDDDAARVIFVPSTGTAFAVVWTDVAAGPPWLSRLAGVGPGRWELWKLGGPPVRVATTSAILLCLEPLAADDAFFCLAQHAAHSVVWSVAGRDGTITRLGAVASRFRLARTGPGHVLLLARDSIAIRVPRDGRGVTRFRVSAEPGAPVGLDASRNHFATLYRDAHRSHLSIHTAR